MNNFKYIKNPNREVYEEISEAIVVNNNYCCCAIHKTPETLCMCKEFREQQESGFCHCGRFYKVQDAPIIAILHSPEDEDHALNIANGLTNEGFIVLLPFYYNKLAYAYHNDEYLEMQKAKIHLANLVFIINSSTEAMKFLDGQIMWAEELNKKIIYEHTEELKENEDRESESI